MKAQLQTSEPANVARFLELRAREMPDRLAVAAPARGGFESWTWSELDAKSNAVARGLARLGLGCTDRVCVFIRPGLAWLALVHGLFKLGAVVVLIDPGMGRRGVLDSIERIRPRALIAVAPLHVARWTNASVFRDVELAVSARPSPLWGDASLEALLEGDGSAFSAAARAPRDPAAILFTSGSTGPAKGVLYEHGMFDAQVRMLRELYEFEPGSADLACFPLFALFGAALGIASVFPELDFARPARCAPEKIVAAIERFAVRTSFGSPAIWRRVIPWCESRGRTLAPLRNLMIAGASIEADLVRRARALLLPGGEVFTPYGATEALPVAHEEGRLLATSLAERAAAGEGTCVGRAAPGVEIRLIEIGDAPVAAWSPRLEVRAGAPGEICVRGANVTREYAFDHRATEAAKIADGETCWHRMGDVGRFDADGRLWFLGRKSQRIETAAGTLHSVPVENVALLDPRVGRCALIGVGERGAERPVLVVETASGRVPRGLGTRARFVQELQAVVQSLTLCAPLERVLFKRNFPLDVRHQAKIDRGALKAWAERVLR